MPASSSATSKRSDVSGRPDLSRQLLQVVAEIRTHHGLAGQVHREHRIGIRPAVAIALHPHQQRADHPAVDGRHAAVTLGGVEKLVRGQHAEFCVGRRISTSTMSGCRWLKRRHAGETMGCRCSANSSSRSAGVDEAEQLLLAREQRQVSRRVVVRPRLSKCNAAMMVVSEVLESGARRRILEHRALRRQRPDGLAPAPATPAPVPATRFARSSSQVVRPENATARRRETARLRKWQAHNVRGRYLRSPTTGRSLARARHADLRLTSAISAWSSASRKSPLDQSACPRLSWIDRERISGWRRMRPRASGASSEADVSCWSGVASYVARRLGAPETISSSQVAT